jgi:integrase
MSKQGVYEHNGRIQVSFTYCNRRFRPTLDLPHTPANVKHAHRLLKRIKQEIANGCFKLSVHFPNYRHIATVPGQSDLADAPTFNAAFDDWMNLKHGELRYSSRYNYLRIHQTHWSPLFGERLISTITEVDIAKHLNKQAISGSHRNNLLIPLRGVFGYARLKEWISRDPTVLLKNVKLKRADPDPFTPQEVELVLDTLRRRNEEIADYFEFAFFAGLRTAEQIELHWYSVDFKNRQVKIQETRVRNRAIDTTKTGSVRVVELNDRALAVLMRQKQRSFLARKHVFLNPHGREHWKRPTQLWKPFAAALKRSEVRHRPAYNTRSTNITRYLMAGAAPQWVADQHGHDLRTMLNHYGRWIPGGDGGREIARINDALRSVTNLSLDTSASTEASA